MNSLETVASCEQSPGAADALADRLELSEGSLVHSLMRVVQLEQQNSVEGRSAGFRLPVEYWVAALQLIDRFDVQNGRLCFGLLKWLLPLKISQTPCIPLPLDKGRAYRALRIC